MVVAPPIGIGDSLICEYWLRKGQNIAWWRGYLPETFV